MAVAITLEGATLGLATISLPLAAASQQQDQEDDAFEPEEQPDLLLAPLPPPCVRLATALAAVRALASPVLPFAVLPAGSDALRVVAPKAHTAAVFKALRAQQGALSVVVGEVKACVSLAPLPPAELETAAAAGLVAALLHRGWHQLDEDRVLGASLLEPAPDGGTQACDSLTLRVRTRPGEASKLTLLVKAGVCGCIRLLGCCGCWPAAHGGRQSLQCNRGQHTARTPPLRLPYPSTPPPAERVEFRHTACRPLGAASLADRSAALAGAACCLLPDLRPALIERLRPADEATLGRLRPLWSAYGQPLPAAVDQLVEVRLDCDPDAPTFPYPPSRVLGQYGLQTVADKRAAPAVQGVLARLRGRLGAGWCGRLSGVGRRRGGLGGTVALGRMALWHLQRCGRAAGNHPFSTPYLLSASPTCLPPHHPPQKQMTWQPRLSSFWETSCVWRQWRTSGTPTGRRRCQAVGVLPWPSSSPHRERWLSPRHDSWRRLAKGSVRRQRQGQQPTWVLRFEWPTGQRGRLAAALSSSSASGGSMRQCRLSCRRLLMRRSAIWRRRRSLPAPQLQPPAQLRQQQLQRRQHPASCPWRYGRQRLLQRGTEAPSPLYHNSRGLWPPHSPPPRSQRRQARSGQPPASRRQCLSGLRQRCRPPRHLPARQWQEGARLRARLRASFRPLL